MPEGPSVTEDRVHGLLLGGALGDALGYPIEFMKAREIDRTWPHGPERLRFASSGDSVALVSDDTQMVLFVAEGLIRANQRMHDRGICDVSESVARALLRWYRTQVARPDGVQDEFAGWLIKEPRLWARRAPGNTNLSALAARLAAAEPAAVAHNDSKGCGAIMRTAPFALLNAVERAFEEAVRSAGATHGHPSGSLSAGYFTALLHGLLRKQAFQDAHLAAERLLVARRHHEETLAAVRQGLELGEGSLPPAEVAHRLGGGWTGESALGIALAAFARRRTHSFEQVLWNAAAHDGDSDSTASLVGQLLGAEEGKNALPSEWLSELELFGLIERVATDLFESIVCDREMSFVIYPPN